MKSTLAGTEFSPSAVYTLVELGHRMITTATGLCQTLKLEKSSISRMLKKLLGAGEIQEHLNACNGREKIISLKPKGADTVARIDRFAESQALNALKKSILRSMCHHNY
jgi:DNA-binding MarR family transcriptional regulator